MSTSSNKKSYQFIHPIATNEEADIYLCQELENELPLRSVVLKILQSNWSENQEAVRQFQADIQLLERLKHRNIAEIYDVIAIRGRTTILMEEVEGIDLKRLILLMKEVRQRIPLRVSLQIVSNVARALDEAYNLPPSSKEWPLRVMHGNLKPSNIMLQSNGLVRILDFGLVRSELGSRESSTRELQYEQREYMAPERLFFEPQSPASDIYSLTMTLFEMIAGKPIHRIVSSEQEHEKKIHSYCKKLLSPLKLSPEFKEALYHLLTEGLSYDSNTRPSAEVFSKKANMLAQAMQGINAVEWSERAVAHFCSADSSRLQGGLQGKVLGEDTQIYTKQNDDSTIRDEVDTAIMRRGAQMELSIDSLSQEAFHEDFLLHNTSDEMPQPLNSSLEHFEESEETYTEPTREPIFDNSKTISSSDRENYRAIAAGHTGQVTNPDVTKQEFSHENSSAPPMMINPQAMVVVEENSLDEDFGVDPNEEANESKSSSKGFVLIGLSLLGFVLVLGVFGHLYKQQIDLSPMETEVVLIKDVPSEAQESKELQEPKEEGIVIISQQKNTQKLEVSCGSERWKGKKGESKLVIPLGDWKNCMIVGRDADRQKVFSEIEQLKKGTYTCFASGESCQWKE